jgi:predicted site-specific integrase-resolvase
MKAKEVLNTLRITRVTLHRYLKDGKISANFINGRYDYDAKSVYALINKTEKLNYIYARVSTQKQKKDLDNQVEKIKSFCFSKGIIINAVYKDIGSGISFDKRTDFIKIIDDVIDYKISSIIITNKDRLSRVGFGLFKNLFNRYGCEIIVIDESLNEKTDSEEIFEEIISLLHCFSMKVYSKRWKKIKEALQN